ncbi:MAG: FHA domain-containing protein [Propionibacteriaceae bacterium]|nr:FHA domain-containing protein [Propionibacteriaceae bacterium]
MIVTDSAGLVGRNPVASGSFSQVVRIDDPDRSVSKTHLQFVVRDGQLFVMDRGSTNGTALQHPGGPKTKLDAGVEVQVAAGDTVFFGDRSFAVQEA